MTGRKLALSLAAASIFAFAAGPGQATTIDTVVDGTFTFSGFDWSKAGAILIDGYDVTSASPGGTTDTFTLYYVATAANLFDENGNPISNALMPNLYATGDGAAPAGAYEYTIVAEVHETVTCVTNPCTVVTITIDSGDWKVWFDQTADAVYADGSGFTDGDVLLSGTFTSGNTVIAPQGPTNPGDTSLAATFFGAVTSTNSTYIVPDLTGTTATSTLQFGATITTPFTLPSSFPVLVGGGTIASAPETNSHFGGQADANQSFQTPEPGSLALLGAGIVVLGFLRRRRA